MFHVEQASDRITEGPSSSQQFDTPKPLCFPNLVPAELTATVADAHGGRNQRWVA